MLRKLVTIRQVSAVTPIKGADLIELLTIEGWRVVSAKGETKVGDFVVYFEIDAFLPDGDPRWQFLVDKMPREFEGKKGHRLCTAKFRGQLSQGFAIPISKCPELQEYIRANTLTEMTTSLSEQFKNARHLDLAELFNVVKYEAPIPPELIGRVKGKRYTFARSTEQERIQNLVSILENREARYEVTLKLEGSSISIYNNEGDIGVSSAGMDFILDDKNVWVNTVKKAKLLEFLQEHKLNVVIQGELMGPGVEGNHEKFKENRIYIFNIIDLKTGRYFDPEQRYELVKKITEACQFVWHIPILHKNVTFEDLKINTFDDMLNFAEGPSIVHEIREGIVWKRIGEEESFKVISNKYLG